MLSELGGGKVKRLQSLTSEAVAVSDWHKVSPRPANRSSPFPLAYGFDNISDWFSLQSAFKLSPGCAGLA